jgi:hypothetical protein
MKIVVSAIDGASHRVLVLAPDTVGLADLEPFASGGEIAELKQIAGLSVDALVGGVTEQELSDTLLGGDYNVLHCASHGDGDGFVLGDTFMDGGLLGRMLSQHDVRLALLLSCHSNGFAAAVAANGVDFVVAMTCAGTNEVARRFAREFYRYLVKINSVPRAFGYAQSRLSADEAAGFILAEAPDGTPQHMMRVVEQLILRLEQMDADGKAWRTEASGLLKTMEANLRQQNRDVLRAVMQLVGVLSHD